MNGNVETIELCLAGVTFKLAPTPVGKLARMQKILLAHGPRSEEGVNAIIEAVFYGARRAGSEITEEWLQTNLDAHSSVKIFEAWRQLNGLVEVAEGAQGEAPAASPS